MTHKELMDLLFTLRWAVSNDKKQYALDLTTQAIGAFQASPLPSPSPAPESPHEEDPERDDDLPPAPKDDGIEEPQFVVVKGVRFKDRGKYQTPSKTFDGLGVHYTVSGRTAASARAVVEYLASKGYGCMVMDEDGKIYIPEGFDVLTEWGAHAGASGWKGRTGMSKYFAGMEICCWGLNPPTKAAGPMRDSKGVENQIKGTYQAYTKAQEASLINFCLWAKKRNPAFKFENVVGHDELRAAIGKKGDKQDPGASLSRTMPKFRELLMELEHNERPHDLKLV